MEPLVSGGQNFYYSVFMEVCKALLSSATVSIIPLYYDGGTMDALMDQFFKIAQARLETRLRTNG